jgi:CDP-paratose synthetase
LNKKKIIAITGSSGYLGKKITNLLKKKYNLLIFSTKKKNNTKSIIYKKYSLSENYKYIFSLKNIEGIVHIATNYGRKNPKSKKIYLANYDIPNKIFEAFIKSDIQYFINTDTFYTLKNNTNLKDYILSKKKFFFKINKSYGKKIINLKLFHIIGKNDNKDKFIPKTIDMLNKNKKIELKFPKNEIDFIHVDDVVEAYIKIINHIDIFKNKFYNINIATGKTYSILKLVKSLKKNLKSKSKIFCLNQFKKKIFESNKKNLIKNIWKPKYSFNRIIDKITY